MTMQIKSTYFWLFFVSLLICSTAQLNRWFGEFWPQSSISCIDSNGDESRTVENLTSCTFTLPLDPLFKKIEDFSEDEAEDLVREIKSSQNNLNQGATVEDVKVETFGSDKLRVILTIKVTATFLRQTLSPGSFFPITSAEVYVVDSVWTGDYTIQFDKRSWMLTWDDQANSMVSTQLSTLTPSSDSFLGNAIEFEVKKDVDSFGKIEMRNLPGNFEVDEALDRYLFTDNARFELTLKNSEINLSTSNIELVLSFEQ